MNDSQSPESSSPVAELPPSSASENDRSARNPTGDGSPHHIPWPRLRLPLILFLVTCLSTFYRGVRHWIPWTGWGEGVDGTILQPSLYDPLFFSGVQIRRDLMQNTGDGLLYMVGLLGILLAHELGHFIATRIYRVPATFPLFIPMPISLFGTMGAVILMDPRKADRKMMFDIGLAGPLAGLVIAVPMMLIGMTQLRLDRQPLGMELGMPVFVQTVLPWLQPAYERGQYIALNQVSPLFMAGWVGLLITGLNMLPVGQLDGGHVTYALFGKGAHWIARVFMGLVFVAIALSIIGQNSFGKDWTYYQWLPMALLVYWIGIYHPPTADDSVELGRTRTIVGMLSLGIAPLTFSPVLFLM